jgi:hypothetical protein
VTVADVEPPVAADGAAKVMPAPVSATVCGLDGALLVMVRVAASLPATVAANAILTVQVEPAVIVAPKHVPDGTKAAAFVPLTTIEAIVIEAVPVLVTVMTLLLVALVFSNCVV